MSTGSAASSSKLRTKIARSAPVPLGPQHVRGGDPAQRAGLTDPDDVVDHQRAGLLVEVAEAGAERLLHHRVLAEDLQRRPLRVGRVVRPRGRRGPSSERSDPAGSSRISSSTSTAWRERALLGLAAAALPAAQGGLADGDAAHPEPFAHPLQGEPAAVQRLPQDPGEGVGAGRRRVQGRGGESLAVRAAVAWASACGAGVGWASACCAGVGWASACGAGVGCASACCAGVARASVARGAEARGFVARAPVERTGGVRLVGLRVARHVSPRSRHSLGGTACRPPHTG